MCWPDAYYIHTGGPRGRSSQHIRLAGNSSALSIQLIYNRILGVSYLGMTMIPTPLACVSVGRRTRAPACARACVYLALIYNSHLCKVHRTVSQLRFLMARVSLMVTNNVYADQAIPALGLFTRLLFAKRQIDNAHATKCYTLMCFDVSTCGKQY